MSYKAHHLFNRFAHSAGPGISVWRLGGMGSVRSCVSHRIGLLGRIGLFGWIGVFGWLAWLIWLMFFLKFDRLGIIFVSSIFPHILSVGFLFLGNISSSFSFLPPPPVSFSTPRSIHR